MLDWFFDHPIITIGGLSALMFGVLALDVQAEHEENEKLFAKCIESGMPQAQCDVLMAIKRKSDAAEWAAASASMNSGLAIGLAAGGRR